VSTDFRIKEEILPRPSLPGKNYAKAEATSSLRARKSRSQEVRSSGVAEVQEANTYGREQILANRLLASRILNRIEA